MEKEEILILAKMAFIELTDKHAEKYLSEIEEIVQNIEKTLDSLNLKDVSNGDYFKKYLTLLMNDSSEKSFDRETMMMNSKRQKDGYILVPKLIKEKK
ncbi:MAG: Asp-tRNA(Asn)/Glu-tRNA(Gln) amidotransferase GatCAB subunit C [bacterium (Candidatus Stahlbacteria) CG23_combo_of_CG06-09_8_20_14_all_34_7]|nr:MAG: Asp-tRNA(Asn)/Glu-tRNA(Gln) amidotransferase GatCAB subunit C [bacterium (Candidatus Stahlbacteria) CG23_combo_of_CG06-09_8_20_14_all_34_7]